MNNALGRALCPSATRMARSIVFFHTGGTYDHLHIMFHTDFKDLKDIGFADYAYHAFIARMPTFSLRMPNIYLRTPCRAGSINA